MQNSEYIKSIVSGLERLNMVNHGSKDPLKKKNNGLIQGEEPPRDIMDWMGKAALDYLNKKKSNENLLS